MNATAPSSFGPWVDALLTQFPALMPEIALASAMAWGAGLRLYLVVFAYGLAAHLGHVELPAHLEVLQHPIVIAASGFMSFVELFADKLPFLDSLWDAVHTVVRIPAGAALAAGVFGDAGAAVALSAALLGGSVTALTHFSKAGTRAAVNTSPEPFSNGVVSTAEDLSVLGGAWLAVAYPAVFLALLAIFLVIAIVLLVVLWRGVRRLLARRHESARARDGDPSAGPPAHGAAPAALAAPAARLPPPADENPRGKR